jgi:hypothetical protein
MHLRHGPRRIIQAPDCNEHDVRQRPYIRREKPCAACWAKVPRKAFSAAASVIKGICLAFKEMKSSLRDASHCSHLTAGSPLAVTTMTVCNE